MKLCWKFEFLFLLFTALSANITFSKTILYKFSIKLWNGYVTFDKPFRISTRIFLSRKHPIRFGKSPTRFQKERHIDACNKWKHFHLERFHQIRKFPEHSSVILSHPTNAHFPTTHPPNTQTDSAHYHPDSSANSKRHLHLWISSGTPCPYKTTFETHKIRRQTNGSFQTFCHPGASTCPSMPYWDTTFLLGSAVLCWRERVSLSLLVHRQQTGHVVSRVKYWMSPVGFNLWASVFVRVQSIVNNTENLYPG